MVYTLHAASATRWLYYALDTSHVRDTPARLHTIAALKCLPQPPVVRVCILARCTVLLVLMIYFHRSIPLVCEVILAFTRASTPRECCDACPKLKVFHKALRTRFLEDSMVSMLVFAIKDIHAHL